MRRDYRILALAVSLNAERVTEKTWRIARIVLNDIATVFGYSQTELNDFERICSGTLSVC